MGSAEKESIVYGIKLSSVGPGSITGCNEAHDPTSVDLAMKLHYLRGVYYFSSPAVEGMTTNDFKEPTFTWLNHFSTACGRFRRYESGRPYVKCNDCGVRFIEAHCSQTLEEWLELNQVDHSLKRLLVSNQVLGPDLAFSPLVLLQVTRFKCGGVALGLSWAHVLGDAFSAADFMKALGQVMAGRSLKLAQSPNKLEISPSPLIPRIDPLSLKQVGPVGDQWITPSSCKMEAFSFQLTTQQTSQLQSKVRDQVQKDQIPLFESLCAVIWKSVAKIRDGEPKVVTICKIDPRARKTGILGNNQVISVVKADFPVMDTNAKELAELVMNGATDERSRIEEAVERDQGMLDFVVYGANLTFIDMEEANFYGFELKGHKPVYVDYSIDGVGDQGVVMLLPGPKGESGGKVVTLIMPENEVFELKTEFEREFSVQLLKY